MKIINKELPLAHSLYRALVKFGGGYTSQNPMQKRNINLKEWPRDENSPQRIVTKKMLRVIKGGFHVFERNEHIVEMLKQLAGSEQSLPGD